MHIHSDIRRFYDTSSRLSRHPFRTAMHWVMVALRRVSLSQQRVMICCSSGHASKAGQAVRSGRDLAVFSTMACRTRASCFSVWYGNFPVITYSCQLVHERCLIRTAYKYLPHEPGPSPNILRWMASTGVQKFGATPPRRPSRGRVGVVVGELGSIA